MRPLHVVVLLLWTGATAGLALLMVGRHVGPRAPRAGRVLAWAALVGPLAALALVSIALGTGAFGQLMLFDPDGPWARNLWGIAVSVLVAGLPVGAGLALRSALVPSPLAPGRVPPLSLLRDVLALVGPVTALVVAWLVFGGNMHPTAQLTGPDSHEAWSLWMRWWPVFLEGLPIAAAVTLVVGLAHGFALERSDGWGFASRCAWALGLHAFAWYVCAVNFPDA